MVQQCDNFELEDYDEPSTGRVSYDQCRTDLGVEDLHKMCKDILFVWSPGSEGEALPDGKGIEALNVFLIHNFYAKNKISIERLLWRKISDAIDSL